MQVRLAWQQLPQLAGVVIAHRGKMGVMVTQFRVKTVFSVLHGRYFGQENETMHRESPWKLENLLRVDPFPAERDLALYITVAITGVAVGIPNACEFETPTAIVGQHSKSN